jgi:hypothetical protein
MSAMSTRLQRLKVSHGWAIKRVNMNSTSTKQEPYCELVASGPLTRLSLWVGNRNLPFLVSSIGMIVILLWAGAFKKTKPGAEGIIPFVSNSQLLWWQVM